MSHTVGQTTTAYTWDVTGGLPVVLQDGENTYVYGLALISSADSQGDQTYYLYDGPGSVTEVTDENGDVVASYGYDVFGAIRVQTGTSHNYWLFTGQQRDEESGFYYLRARYYDPSIGRFLSRDPIPAVNFYAYVGNNPVMLTDPYGLCPGWDPRWLLCQGAGLLPGGLAPGGKTQFYATCAIYHPHCNTVRDLGLYANERQLAIYGEDTELTPADRFQHCLWSGSITVMLGARFAKTITSRWEEYPGNTAEHKSFDLVSNQLGIQFARNLDYATDSFGLPKNPTHVLETVENYCQSMADKE
jgi:RHS repeat-associated protein